MFRKDLKRRLEAIFGMDTTFEAPDFEGDALEQDTLFIEVLDVKPRLSGKDRATCRVNGSLAVFSQDDRLPYGFFAKKVEQAKFDDTANLYFERETDVGASPARLQNIHERRVGFTFLYDTQYDPDRGALTSLNLSLEIGD